MRKTFGFVIASLLCGMMGCNGANQAAGNNQSSGSSGSSPQIPAAPTTLTATAANGQVSLSWTGSASASGYNIKRGSASGGPYTLLTSSTQASYMDTSVNIGATYYYVVTAFNSAGESGNSNEASATLTHTPTTYYVSPSGSDSSPGTLAQPFATVQHGVNQLLAGDTLILRAGNYHETVTVSTSGTANAPITIQAYAGECPVLIGATAVTGWSVSSGAIYTASWPTQPVQVFGAGQLLNEARWPNTAVEDYAGMTYATADSGTQDYITSSALPDVDLTGAWVHVMAGQSWVVYDRQVTAHDRASGKLTFSSPINAISALVPRRGNHFIVFGKLELLDSPGEWWWDPSAQRLYVWMPDGGSPEGRVEAGTAPSVLSLAGQSYVTFSGLSARGGWFNLQNSTHCTVRQFHLKAPTWTRIVNGFAVQPEYLGGVDLSGSGNLVDGGLVQLAGRSSIHDAGTGNTVQQVTVEDSGWNWGAEGAIDAANLLKPALARGELQCIGATTLDEYRKYIEKDAALERRFQPVVVDQPTVEETISILRGLREKYELHHGIRITDSALVAAATLSNRYITERFLPDKAIDLMDEAASRLRMEIDSMPVELDELERRRIQLEIEREALRKETDEASKARLEILERELAETGEEAAAMKQRWSAEKEAISGVRATKAEIEALHRRKDITLP